MKSLYSLFIIVLFINTSKAQFINTSKAQDYNMLTKEFDSIAKFQKGLNEKISVNVSGVNLYELLTSIAEEHKLNMSVSVALKQPVVSNFYNLKVKEVLSFLIHKYKMKFEVVGKVLYFTPMPKKEVKIPKPKIKSIDVTYRKENDFLSVNLVNDSLYRVARAITDKSGKNIVLSPITKSIRVSAYIKNRPFDQVIEMVAKSNGLVVNKDENDFYYFDKIKEKKGRNKNSKIRNQRKGSNGDNKDVNITVDSQKLLSIKAYDADVVALIKASAEKSNSNFFMYDEPKGLKTNVLVENISFEQLLKHVFKGKDYNFTKSNDIYIIGKDNKEGIRSTELIALQNRTIESVLASIPTEMTSGLEIKEFIELNSLIVTGYQSKIKELKNFIFQIDKVVPLVQIEVLIVQYKKAYELQTGITAGLKKDNNATSGVLFPQNDVNLHATTINGLIDAFNGLGIFKIGKVTKQFYLNLKALENNSIISLKSTPKIATLSGHKASVSIGETSYYYEQNNRLINSGVSQNILQSGQWKSTQASLSVNITPFVSQDEFVTLEISVEKSSFLARAGKDAPPGKTTQKFNALVRIKNGEMILLGGLDEFEKGDSGTGTPFLSRIPVIKWFFSSRSKKKSKAKLHVFIKPTVIY